MAKGSLGGWDAAASDTVLRKSQPAAAARSNGSRQLRRAIADREKQRENTNTGHG